MRSNQSARVARMAALAGLLTAVAVIPSTPVSARVNGPHPASHGMATTGSAADLGSAPALDDDLWLSVVHGEDPDGGNREWAVLNCGNGNGTHPDADKACQALRSVDGDISALPATQQMCPRIYAPVVAQAQGRWHGSTVRYTKQFPNSCEMNARTGPVFDFGQH
jgi:Subtilisin inhibitor-like